MIQGSEKYIAEIDQGANIDDVIVAIKQSSGTIVRSDTRKGTIVFEASVDDADAIRELCCINSVVEAEEEEPEVGSNESFV
jgi:hypothetical protein